MGASIYGIALAKLFLAIATVESERGATSVNPYQIRTIYVDDVNRVYGNNPAYKRFSYGQRYDWGASEDMMTMYWRHYGDMYLRETGKMPTVETLAKMHNQGGRYWKRDWRAKRDAERYWQKVKRELDKCGKTKLRGVPCR